ncbi:unnamed protein product, partial [Owenia fusiformis]
SRFGPNYDYHTYDSAQSPPDSWSQQLEIQQKSRPENTQANQKESEMDHHVNVPPTEKPLYRSRPDPEPPLEPPHQNPDSDLSPPKQPSIKVHNHPAPDQSEISRDHGDGLHKSGGSGNRHAGGNTGGGSIDKQQHSGSYDNRNFDEQTYGSKQNYDTKDNYGKQNFDRKQNYDTKQKYDPKQNYDIKQQDYHMSESNMGGLTSKTTKVEHKGRDGDTPRQPTHKDQLEIPEKEKAETQFSPYYDNPHKQSKPIYNVNDDKSLPYDDSYYGYSSNNGNPQRNSYAYNRQPNYKQNGHQRGGAKHNNGRNRGNGHNKDAGLKNHGRYGNKNHLYGYRDPYSDYYYPPADYSDDRNYDYDEFGNMRQGNGTLDVYMYTLDIVQYSKCCILEAVDVYTVCNFECYNSNVTFSPCMTQEYICMPLHITK